MPMGCYYDNSEFYSMCGVRVTMHMKIVSLSVECYHAIIMSCIVF